METRSERNIKMKKVKKKKLNIARTLVLVLILYILVCLVIYVYKEPVKHYEISGNSLVTDSDILRSARLSNYPSFVSINTKKVKRELEKNVLIRKAKVSYSWDFTISIEIEENRPMFLSKSTDQVCLSDGTLTNYNESFFGIPILLNDTPEKVMKTLASNLSKIDDGILYMINDIEYKPSYNAENQVIDQYRFLLSMNDKNLVYVNAKRLKPLNRYLDVIATKRITQNGIFYLDGDENRYPFRVFNSSAPEGSEQVEG